MRSIVLVAVYAAGCLTDDGYLEEECKERIAEGVRVAVTEHADGNTVILLSAASGAPGTRDAELAAQMARYGRMCLDGYRCGARITCDIVPETPIWGTLAETRAFLSRVDLWGAHNLICVTSQYHVPRVGLTMMRELRTRAKEGSSPKVSHVGIACFPPKRTLREIVIALPIAGVQWLFGYPVGRLH